MDFILQWEQYKENKLNEINAKYTDLFKSENIPLIYEPMLYKFSFNEEIKNWNYKIYENSIDKLNYISKKIDINDMELTIKKNIGLLIICYENLLSIEDRIQFMNRFHGSEELKIKYFAFSIYNDLLNGCLSSITKIFIELESVMSGKNQQQETLSPQLEFLKKRDYDFIVNLADKEIRNSISHGGFKVDSRGNITFVFREGNDYISKTMTAYIFKDILYKLFDGISGIILSFIKLLCERNIGFESMTDVMDKNSDEYLFWEKKSISTFLIDCNNIWKTKIVGEDSHQVNIEFISNDLEENEMLIYGINVARIIYLKEKLDINDTIMVSFNSPKVMSSFLKVKNIYLSLLSKSIMTIEEVANKIIESGDVFLNPINNEKRNIFEDSFRYYPDIDNDYYTIKEIEDISTENSKRLKATVYLKNDFKKNEIRNISNYVVEELKKIENFGFSNNPTKHGVMNADILYFVIYRNEPGRKGNRFLSPENDNFIVQVQYDVDKKFPIKISYINQVLKKQTKNFIQYYWNPKF